MALEQKSIAIIGGTGQLGSALSGRWRAAGLNVLIGSRSGTPNAEAAQKADIVVVTVPFAAQAETYAQIAPFTAGKIVIDTTVPLMPPKVMRVQLPQEDSAAMRARSFLNEETRLVSAFHNVAAHKLAEAGDVDCDVLVFGDDAQARRVAIELAERAGMRGLHGGPLANSTAAEALTSILIFLNKTYRVDGAGLRITGELHPPA